MYKAEKDNSEDPFRDKYVTEVSYNEEFFDWELDDTEDETQKEENASESKVKCQANDNEITDKVSVEEEARFDGNVTSDISERAEDSAEKELSREPLDKVAKNNRSDHIKQFEIYVKKYLSEVDTQ